MPRPLYPGGNGHGGHKLVKTLPRLKYEDICLDIFYQFMRTMKLSIGKGKFLLMSQCVGPDPIKNISVKSKSFSTRTPNKRRDSFFVWVTKAITYFLSAVNNSNQEYLSRKEQLLIKRLGKDKALQPLIINLIDFPRSRLPITLPIKQSHCGSLDRGVCATAITSGMWDCVLQEREKFSVSFYSIFLFVL